MQSGKLWDSYIARREWIKGLLSKINKEELIGVEVGVWRGYFIKHLLTVEPRIKRIYAIDRTFSENTINRIVHRPRGKVSIVWGESQEVVNDIPFGVDFVHIDGGHGYGQVMSDLTLYEPKIANGGLICGHDYYGFSSRWVKRAVDEYAIKNKRDLHSVGGEAKSWWWYV